MEVAMSLQPLFIQTYRTKPGDLDIPDRPALPDVEDAKLSTKKHLESYLDRQASHDPIPTLARLIDGAGNVIAEFRLTQSGAVSIPIGSTHA
jgi:hypothetical protein